MFAAVPSALVDMWLLREFPGRTLEELDGIDFGRLWRALSCRAVLRAEEARELYLQGKYKPTPEEWKAILRNDAALDMTWGRDGKSERNDPAVC